MPELSDEKLQAYLRELTEISHRYGLGITGKPEPFILVEEDTYRLYRL